MKIPFEMVKKVLGTCFDKAKVVLSDPKKIKELLEESEKKLKKVPYIGDKLANVPILFSMMYSYVRKEYTDISTKTLITIIATLIYLVSPIDLILDKIPIIGMIDDAAILSFCYSNITPDIEKYKKWKAKKEKESAKEKTKKNLGNKNLKNNKKGKVSKESKKKLIKNNKK